MSTATGSYHHGDLRAALVRAAMELLEEDGGDLSVRAAARRAGVSTAAPYRHFADRRALASAVAAVGYRELATRLAEAAPEPSSIDDLAAIALAYVDFALARPGLFRVMFAEPCDPTSPERVAATTAMHGYVESVVAATVTTSDPEATATAMWALVHGLAFLHLDGKFDITSHDAVADRIRRAVTATLSSR